MSPDKVRKKMQKEVNATRGALHGGSNRWMVGIPIGPKSEEVSKSQQEAYEKWTNSESYKKAKKESERLLKLWNKERINDDEYEKRYTEVWKDALSTKPPSNSHTVGKERKYFDNYIDTVGKNMTIAYLQDIGFTEKGAKEVQKIIRKSGKKVLD